MKNKRHSWSKEDFTVVLEMLSNNYKHVDYTELKKQIAFTLGIEKVNPVNVAIKSFLLMNNGISPQGLKGGPGFQYTSTQKQAFNEFVSISNFSKNKLDVMLDKK